MFEPLIEGRPHQPQALVPVGPRWRNAPPSVAHSPVRYEVSAPDDASEREADQIAEAVLGTGALPSTGLLPGGSGSEPPVVQRQWSDAPADGARSSHISPPNTGWNTREQSVGAVRRIPVEGLSTGNQDPSSASEAAEHANGRAIALIPQLLNSSGPVEVLLHFHGYNIGYRQRTATAGNPEPGTVRDVERDRIEQQIQASNRPLIGVLAQGTTTSGFGGLSSDPYIGEVMRKLGAIGAFGPHPPPVVARVILSGHSGAGAPLSRLLAAPGQPGLPAALGEVALFDAIGPHQLDQVTGWVLSRLTKDLGALTGSGATVAGQRAYLSAGVRFRAYYTNGYYAKPHERLQATIRRWFAKNAVALGGLGASVYQTLLDHYQVIPVGHGDHEHIMGKADRLLDALGALPPAPTTLGPSPPPASLNAPGVKAPGAAGSQPIQPSISGSRGGPTAIPPNWSAVTAVGTPLDAQTQARFGRRLGRDLSQVRVHTDSEAADSAAALHARAYTAGRDVVFGSGQFAPGTPQGDRLLAHELAHVAQQGRGSSVKRLQRQVVSEHLDPIRQDETSGLANSTDLVHSEVIKNKVVTVTDFSIFLPPGVQPKKLLSPKVHVFFSAALASGSISNDILTHGLRGASKATDWILIGVPSKGSYSMEITDARISDCLAAVGVTAPVSMLRLTGHSRGGFGLMRSVTSGKLSKGAIDRVTLLDADDNQDPSTQDTKTPKVEVLRNAGIPTGKIVAYEVNVRKRHIKGADYRQVASADAAAVGYVRLIKDAMVTQPASGSQKSVADLVAGDPDVKNQLDSLPLPPRGTFTTGPATATRTNFQEFCLRHRKEINAILAQPTGKRSLLTFINRYDLARFSPYEFSQQIAAHHFFVAEFAHELSE